MFCGAAAKKKKGWRPDDICRDDICRINATVAFFRVRDPLTFVAIETHPTQKGRRSETYFGTYRFDITVLCT